MDHHYVYELRSKAAGVRYIGSTKDLDRRSYEHFQELRGKRHHNHRLQKVWDDYEDLQFVITDGPMSKDDVLRTENMAIEAALVVGDCVNISLRGDYLTHHPRRDEIVEKITKTKIGRPRAESTKRKLSEHFKGRPMSEEVVGRMQRADRGKVIPVVIDGVRYFSMKEAYRQLGIHWHTIRDRCRNPNFPNYIAEERSQ